MTIYEGSVTSALARTRKVLKAAGYDIGKIVGRYHPIGGMGTQRTIPGWNASRAGTSKRIYLLKYGAPRVASQLEDFPTVLQALRDAGLPFDDSGELVCRYAPTYR